MSDVPVRDSEATRRRLLSAATDDFAARGIAGARVDRIAAEAGVNKAQLYAYFGDKLGLFRAVFATQAADVADSVRFTADDLGGYAVRLYDAGVRKPELVRLAVWAALEGVARAMVDTPDAAVKLTAIAEAQRAGTVTDAFDPAHVLGMVTSMALTWSSAGIVCTASPDDTPEEHERRRNALSVAVTRAFHVGR